MLSAAHKDKGIPQSLVMRSLWINAPFVRVQTAHPDAICDLPLLVFYGSKPEMREDMVRIGTGLSKTANLAWRAQFTVWALRVTGRYNASTLNEWCCTRSSTTAAWVAASVIGATKRTANSVRSTTPQKVKLGSGMPLHSARVRCLSRHT